ncbi:MAG: hypothetical protein IKE21_06420 [Erysipelotrichaceae bacterium]|nr:hypothetical protein [Erysipelotrichaceae bacterium]
MCVYSAFFSPLPLHLWDSSASNPGLLVLFLLLTLLFFIRKTRKKA